MGKQKAIHGGSPELKVIQYIEAGGGKVGDKGHKWIEDSGGNRLPFRLGGNLEYILKRLIKIFVVPCMVIIPFFYLLCAMWLGPYIGWVVV